MRAALLAIALVVAGCGSDVGADDLGAPDLAFPRIDIGGRRPEDLASDCPAVGTGAVGSFGPCSRPDAYCGPVTEETCHCNVQSQTWYCCWSGQRQPCPATPPSGTDCCIVYDPQCSYACAGGVATVCSCTDDAWHCTTMPCD